MQEEVETPRKKRITDAPMKQNKFKRLPKTKKKDQINCNNCNKSVNTNKTFMYNCHHICLDCVFNLGLYHCRECGILTDRIKFMHSKFESFTVCYRCTEYYKDCVLNTGHQKTKVSETDEMMEMMEDDGYCIDHDTYNCLKTGCGKLIY